MIEHDLTDISALQRVCPDSRDMIIFLEKGILPVDDQKARKIAITSENYELIDGELFFISRPRNQKIAKLKPVVRLLQIPRSLRGEIVESYHSENGHLGFEKLFATITEKYHWQGMWNDLLEITKSCISCQTAKKTTKPKFTPMHVIPPGNSILSKWHMDIAGPLPLGEDGSKYILLVVDSLSRWPEIFCLKTMTSEEIAECLYKVITRFGAFDTLVSDLGSQLTSRVTKALMRVFKVKRVHTSSYRPKSNGIAERHFKDIWQYLRHYVDDKNQGDWCSFIDPLLYSMRGAVSVKTTGLSPFECLYGRPMKMIVDTQFLIETNLPKDVECYMKSLRPRVELTEKVVFENKMSAQEKNKKYHDRGSVEPKFEIGDCVFSQDMSRTVGVSKKLQQIHSGPLIIVQKGSKNSYRLRNAVTDKPPVHPVNGDRLKLCNPPAEKFYTKVEKAKREWAKLQTDSHKTNTGRDGESEQRDLTSDAPGVAHGKAGESTSAQDTCTTPSHSDGVNNDVVVGQPDKKNSDGLFPIIELLKRRGKGSKLMYLTKFEDGSEKWVKNTHITTAAKQAYYKKEAEKGIDRRRRRRRSY